jgi:hypothetical protein
MLIMVTINIIFSCTYHSHVLHSSTVSSTDKNRTTFFLLHSIRIQVHLGPLTRHFVLCFMNCKKCLFQFQPIRQHVKKKDTIEIIGRLKLKNRQTFYGETATGFDCYRKLKIES